MLILAREWGYKGDIWQRGSGALLPPGLHSVDASLGVGGRSADAVGRGPRGVEHAWHQSPLSSGALNAGLHPGGGAFNTLAASGGGPPFGGSAPHMGASLPLLAGSLFGSHNGQQGDSSMAAASAAVNAALQGHLAAIAMAAQQQQNHMQQQQQLMGSIPFLLSPHNGGVQANHNGAMGAGFGSPGGGVPDVSHLCEAMRQLGGETALVWEKVVVRAAKARPQQVGGGSAYREEDGVHHSEGADCGQPCCQGDLHRQQDVQVPDGRQGDAAAVVARDTLRQNATACAVTHWLRGVALAHSASLATGDAQQQHLLMTNLVASVPTTLTLMQQVAELLATSRTCLEGYRSVSMAHLVAQGLADTAPESTPAVPSSAAAADGAAASAMSTPPSVMWLQACSMTLDELLSWLAHAKSVSQAQGNPVAALLSGALVARLSEALFGSAEDMLLLRRQWLALSMLDHSVPPQGTHLAAPKEAGAFPDKSPGGGVELVSGATEAVVMAVLSSIEATGGSAGAQEAVKQATGATK